MSHKSRFFAIAMTFFVVAMLMLGTTACAPRGPDGPRKATNWAYAPASISIHPLSRFKNPSKAQDPEELDDQGNPINDRMIVVHITLMDGDGFVCRGVGTLQVTIADPQFQVLATEIVDLEDPDINRLRFDGVTRTYRVLFNRLPEDCAKVYISATFTAENEPPLQSKSFSIISHPPK